MIKFYGSPMSSSGRTHWMLEEIGVPYEYVRVDLRDEQQRKAFAGVHPNGRVPLLVDEDFVLFESMAINAYLAEKYAPQMLPQDLRMRALVHQWSYWALSNLQPLALQVMSHTMFLPEAERNAKLAEQARTGCRRLLDVLEPSLGGEFLVVDRFGLADVNVGSVVNLAVRTDPSLAGPRVQAWLERLRARPAYQKAVKSA